jgi:hypothetical protein
VSCCPEKSGNNKSWLFILSNKKYSVMAELRKRTLVLSTDKEIKLFGNSIAIGKGLQIGEGYVPNIYSCIEEAVPPEKNNQQATPGQQENGAPKKQAAAKTRQVVVNPYRLTEKELSEMADYCIRLWMDLKDSVRKYGIDDPRVFNRDGII